jgi:hypothetical protein
MEFVRKYKFSWAYNIIFVKEKIMIFQLLFKSHFDEFIDDVNKALFNSILKY